jgi:hypothetical protein
VEGDGPFDRSVFGSPAWDHLRSQWPSSRDCRAADLDEGHWICLGEAVETLAAELTGEDMPQRRLKAAIAIYRLALSGDLVLVTFDVLRSPGHRPIAFPLDAPGRTPRRLFEHAGRINGSRWVFVGARRFRALVRLQRKRRERREIEGQLAPALADTTAVREAPPASGDANGVRQTVTPEPMSAVKFAERRLAEAEANLMARGERLVTDTKIAELHRMWDAEGRLPRKPSAFKDGVVRPGRTAR